MVKPIKMRRKMLNANVAFWSFAPVDGAKSPTIPAGILSTMTNWLSFVGIPRCVLTKITRNYTQKQLYSVSKVEVRIKNIVMVARKFHV